MYTFHFFKSSHWPYFCFLKLMVINLKTVFCSLSLLYYFELPCLPERQTLPWVLYRPPHFHLSWLRKYTARLTSNMCMGENFSSNIRMSLWLTLSYTLHAILICQVTSLCKIFNGTSQTRFQFNLQTEFYSSTKKWVATIFRWWS